MIEFYDPNNNLITTRPAPPSSGGWFAGIEATAGISRLKITNSPSDDFYCDDLYYGRTAQAQVSSRNAGLNPTSYSATPAVLGSTVTATVDLTTTGHPFARLMYSLVPKQRTLSSGYVVLVGGPRVAMLTGVPGPLATFSIPIPNDTALCGRRFYTQAVHFGGGMPFALSNSQDFVIGR